MFGNISNRVSRFLIFLIYISELQIYCNNFLISFSERFAKFNTPCNIPIEYETENSYRVYYRTLQGKYRPSKQTMVSNFNIKCDGNGFLFQQEEVNSSRIVLRRKLLTPDLRIFSYPVLSIKTHQVYKVSTQI